ncbi:MAG: hypothetical protein LBG79_00160 [Spirochaetaceae bacterium]|nr:hypothetical protein [Spirochaetaceae bacterium]
MNINRLKSAKTSFAVKIFFQVSLLVFTVAALLTAGFQFLISRDLMISAETNNFTLNHEAAFNSKRIIENTITSVLFFIETGGNRLEELYFRNNPHVIAVKSENFIVLNNAFFLAYNLKPQTVVNFFSNHKNEEGQAAYGITRFTNASTELGVPVIGIFFRAQRGGAAAALMSTDVLNGIFNSGANNSIMINDSGELLASSDTDKVLNGANLFQTAFIRNILESGDISMQRRYTSEDGTAYFGAFQKLSEYNIFVITTIEEEVALEALRIKTREAIYFALIILAAAFVFIWFWINYVSRHVTRLSVFARKLEEGDYTADIDINSNDEHGALAVSLRELRTRLAERDRLASVLARFSNMALVQKALRGRISPGGKETEVTVLAARLLSFNSISMELEGAAAAQIFNTFFSIIFESVQKTGGTIVNFSSGAVLAVWGAPEKNGDKKSCAKSALNTALYFRAALAAYNAARRPLLRSSCGIDSGRAFCGQTGTKERMEWQILGLPVLNAFWAEEECVRQNADILLTAATKKYCAKEFVFEKKTVVTVKGKRETLETFAILEEAKNNKELIE